MKVSAFDFDLPRECIAQHPADPRDGAKLLVIPSPLMGEGQGGGAKTVSPPFLDKTVRDLPSLLRPGDLMVFNDTRVIPARLQGRRGEAHVEVTLHKQESTDIWCAFAKPARRLKVGDEITFIPSPQRGEGKGGGAIRQSPNLHLQRARQLRINATDAEKRLWYHLRKQQLSGFKFRRQYRIPPYIVDFACLEKKLIVELDGGQHSEQQSYDEKRTAYLKKRGYRVLRFWNHEVFENTDGVLEAISAALATSPHPTPPPRRGDGIRFHSSAVRTVNPSFTAEVLAKAENGEVTLRFNRSGPELMEALQEYGIMPLPPYISRDKEGNPQDREDYQTMFAAREGAVAAPTAGLHFTPELLKAIEANGIETATVTLHVGAGTFLPVKVDHTEDHRMHSEIGVLDAATANRLNAARARGGRIVAVGTTSLRLLESAADDNDLIHPFSGETDIFITPGYRFKAVDVLMTNFHLPKSTLFMLVSAFSGLDRMKTAYAHAIANNYRFYSYGDACLLFPSSSKAAST